MPALLPLAAAQWNTRLLNFNRISVFSLLFWGRSGWSWGMFALPPPSELIWKHVWVTKKGERKDKIQMPKLKINRNCTYRKRAGELYRGSFKRLWPHGLEVALCVWETETEERWFRKSANFESSEQTFPAQKAAKDRVLIEFNSYFFHSCMKIYNFHIKHIQIVYFI